MKDSSLNFKTRLVLVAAFLLSLSLIAYAFDLKESFNLEAIKILFMDNLLIGISIFVGLFVIGNFIQIPGLIFLAAAVLTLGKVHGGIVTYLAAITSCMVSFFVIRAIGGQALTNLKFAWANKIFNQLGNYPIRSIFILRSVFQTQPLLNYSLALSNVKFRDYLIGTIIGLPLPITVYCLFIDSILKLANIN